MKWQDMEFWELLRKLKGLKFMSFLIHLPFKERLIRETKIKTIDHILTALCECELNEKGREYLNQLKNELRRNISDSKKQD